MPRPIKMRKICCLPENNRFGPLDFSENSVDSINMTVDEYESIRLIDLEGFTQEECARQMSVSRTTVQGIYDGARKKLAESLINGRELLVSGGEYQLCSGEEKGCGKGRCLKRRRGRG